MTELGFKLLIALDTCTVNNKMSQTNNVSSYLKEIEKEEQNASIKSRRKRIIKIRARINKSENWKTI